jgi:hypothetical protein
MRTSESQAPLGLSALAVASEKVKKDLQRLQHLDAVESVQTTFGVAVLSPLMVVARAIWMLVHVVLVRS